MPLFSIGNHQKNYSMFTLEVMLDLYAYFISFVLKGAYNILRAIVLLFSSDSIYSFLFDGKFISFLLYWSIKGLIFEILCDTFSMFW